MSQHSDGFMAVKASEISGQLNDLNERPLILPPIYIAKRMKLGSAACRAMGRDDQKNRHLKGRKGSAL